MDAFTEMEQDKEVISKRKESFRQSHLISADQKFPEIPFLREVEAAIKSRFAVLGTSGSILGLLSCCFFFFLLFFKNKQTQV